MSIRKQLESMNVGDIIYTQQPSKQITSAIAKMKKQNPMWKHKRFTTEHCWIISVMFGENKGVITRVIRRN